MPCSVGEEEVDLSVSDIGVHPQSEDGIDNAAIDRTDIDRETLDWLLDGDPAIRWQVERDLLDAPESQWRATRATIGRTGWGHDLLASQDASGMWADGLYQPKWTSTNYTLLLLRRMGLDPADARARMGCRRLLDEASWPEGGVSYWPSHDYAERCVNAMVLSVCSYFEVDDSRLDSIAGLLLSARMDDGAWNCSDRIGAIHSSFHTTISALEAIDLWRAFRSTHDADPVIASGSEFLLRHQMFRSHRDGSVINPEWLKAHFPPRWHYDLLRGMDFLASIRATRDERADDAIGVILSSRRADGRWPKGSQYSGEVFFTLEPGRVAGRWNTLRALRVLRWWSHSQ